MYLLPLNCTLKSSLSKKHRVQKHSPGSSPPSSVGYLCSFSFPVWFLPWFQLSTRRSSREMPVCLAKLNRAWWALELLSWRKEAMPVVAQLVYRESSLMGSPDEFSFITSLASGTAYPGWGRCDCTEQRRTVGSGGVCHHSWRCHTSRDPADLY